MTAALHRIDDHPAVRRTLAVVGSPAGRLALTVALVAFGLSQIPIEDVVARLEGARLPLVVLGVLLLLAGQALSGERWRELARTFGLRASRRFFVTAYLRGCFFNAFLPTGIGGDAVRITLAKPLGSWRSATRSVVVDRVTGLLALALAAGILLPLAGFGLPGALTWSAAALSAAALAALSWVAARRALGAWLLLTLAYEVVWLAGVLLLARALGIGLAWATPSVVLVVGLAMALPISFGGHGAREAGFVLVLAPLGIAADAAVALGVLFGASLAVAGLAGAFVRVPPVVAVIPTDRSSDGPAAGPADDDHAPAAFVISTPRIGAPS